MTPKKLIRHASFGASNGHPGIVQYKIVSVISKAKWIHNLCNGQPRLPLNFWGLVFCLFKLHNTHLH